MQYTGQEVFTFLCSSSNYSWVPLVSTSASNVTSPIRFPFSPDFTFSKSQELSSFLKVILFTFNFPSWVRSFTTVDQQAANDPRRFSRGLEISQELVSVEEVNLVPLSVVTATALSGLSFEKLAANLSANIQVKIIGQEVYWDLRVKLQRRNRKLNIEYPIQCYWY